MDSLFEEIKKLHWVWFWSGNWPLLDCWPHRDKNFETQLKTLAGCYPRATIDFFENGLITAFHCQEEYDRMAEIFYKRFQNNPNFIAASLKDYKEKTDTDLRALERINKLKINGLSNNQLAKLFKESRKYLIYNSTIDHYAWYLEKFFIPKLEDYLTAELSKRKKEHLVLDYIFSLVTPRKKSRVFKEKTELFALVKKIKSKPRLLKYLKKHREILDFKNNFPDYYQTVYSHWKQYNWLGVLVNNPPLKLQELWHEILGFLFDKNKDFKIESCRLGDVYDKKIFKKRKKIISELKPDKSMRSLIRGLETTAFIRTEDNAIAGHSSFFLIPLFREVAVRLGINYYGLKELNPEEVIYLLKNKESAKSLVKKRLKGACLVVFRGRRKIFTGIEANKFKEVVMSQIAEKTEGGTLTFKGICASRGKIIGRVKLAMSSRDSYDIQEREILVAPATSADFVPAMRKAGAIITEFGGLTSHSAIVSREFGIPCIVGVKDITKFVKTGNLVEVDAEKGIVKILKRK